MADASAILCLSSQANVPSISSNATALIANPNRTTWSVQNLGTNPLFVLMGSGASTSVFHVVLKGSTMADDGTGGVVSQEAGTVYTGIITIAGSSPRYVATEIGIN